MKSKIIICSTVFLLSACSADNHSGYGIKKWTPSEYMDILEAEKALPEDSILIAVLMDYDRTRKELAACSGN